jgi:hypothetical protein
VDIVPVKRGPLQITIEEEGRTRLKIALPFQRRPQDICAVSMPRLEMG